MTKRSRCSHRYSVQHVSSDFLFSLHVVAELPGIRGAWRCILDFAFVTTHHVLLPGPCEHRPTSSIRPTRYGAQIVGVGLLLWRVSRPFYGIVLWDKGEKGLFFSRILGNEKAVFAYCGGHLIYNNKLKRGMYLFSHVNRNCVLVALFIDHE